MTDDFELLDHDLEAELVSYYNEIEDGAVVEYQLSDEMKSELKSGNDSFADKSLHAEGGSKVVSKIKDLRTSRSVAIAELKMGFTEAQAERFLHEARITAALEHPNIVPIYDIGLNKYGKPFFTMKFLKDQSLRRVIKELRVNNPEYVNKYSLAILLDIFVKVCEAVSFAHSKGVVHLDLKPANIMIGDY